MIELDRIYRQDCFQGFKEMCPESVDFIILDPDYNDWVKMLDMGIIQECLKLLKPEGNLICFTKQPFDFNLRNRIDDIFRREFVWTFENGGAWVSKRMPLVSSQKIYWCVKSKAFFFNPRTGLSYSEKTKDFKRKNKVFGGYNKEGREFKKSDEGCWMRDHYHYNKPMVGKIPAKPLELITIFVNCLCPEGGVVLDPFMGSGTTAVACLNTNRHFVGFELNDEPYEKALKRIEELYEL